MRQQHAQVVGIAIGFVGKDIALGVQVVGRLVVVGVEHESGTHGAGSDQRQGGDEEKMEHRGKFYHGSEASQRLQQHDQRAGAALGRLRLHKSHHLGALHQPAVHLVLEHRRLAG